MIIFNHNGKEYSIANLNHLYDFLADTIGYENADAIEELIYGCIDENVSRETSPLKKNIEIYSDGFNQALHWIDTYEEIYGTRDNLVNDMILKAERLDNKIYKVYNKPDYSADIEEG